MIFSEIRRFAVVIVGSLLVAVSLNFFLINANVFSSGFTGAAQLVASISNDFFNLKVSTGLLYFIFNIPVLILGWMKIGRSFTIYSIISVVFTSVFLQLLPVLSISDDILLNAVFGGVIGGVGVGFVLKIGASTGGMDIVAMVLSRMHDKPIGVFIFALNGIIVATAGTLYNLENALYTIVSLYVTTVVIDSIHTRHQKLTVMIITDKAEAIQSAIIDKMIRGITVLPAKGAYSGEDRKMLYLVITRYELYELEKIIYSVDEKAFTNIVETVEVLGHFRTEVL